ncbi:Multidrug resistance protein MdtA [Pseudoalteromonas holothuriae]|uniref:Multidrug resistance protein MdtA n=1 Tax=Pseudoalteromonas holothuriae TaxID=2963714 RepID=A0A9W4QR63_9GAMM|nr:MULTISPECIES: HlyD family efflux transporter periplasmic adaptor subunit [unclassified Pseudoalteromonas]CAH9049674.1 Multidrug resistance protein MdtA [Pseudoalteromonas sp. CIP111854]CAH9051601.1 Multidrug resistance protein MdtA [Pseudoalteromonas sp. CIP111951]
MKRVFSSLRVRQAIATTVALFFLLVVLDELEKAEQANIKRPTTNNAGPSLHVASVVNIEPVTQLPSLMRLGYVEPLKMTEITSDVSGRIISVTDAFRKGQLLDKSSALLHVDPLPYRVALANAQSQWAQAKTELKNAQTQYDAKSLVVKSAQSQLKLAELQVEQAKVDLNRTVIALPFDGELVQIKANLGEYVGPGSSVASALPKAKREIRVPINIEEFDELDTPLLNKQLTVYSLNKLKTWQGKVTGVSHFSENQQRTLYVSIDSEHSSLPMFGENVYVQLPHKNWQNTYSVPESALTEKYEIWLLDEHNKTYRHKLNEFTMNNGMVYFPMPNPQFKRVVEFPRGYLSQGMELAVKSPMTTKEAL